MDLPALKTLGQIAGVGGISLGVFLLLFRDIIRKSIFPNLNRQQAYRLLTLMIVMIWSVALAGLVAWVYTGTRSSSARFEDQNWKHDYELIVPLRDPITTSETGNPGTTIELIFRSQYAKALSSLVLKDNVELSVKRDRLLSMVRNEKSWNKQNPNIVVMTSDFKDELEELKSRIRSAAVTHGVDVERVECLSGIVARC